MPFNLFLCFLICFVTSFSSAANSTLKFVNVVFRHGDRTPIPPYELYPNDPYKNYNFNPPGYGQLTISGEIRASKLGGMLCEKYCDFLGNDYVPGSIEARSTNFNRTKESLNLLLNAMYPGTVIESYYQPLENDTLLFPLLCKLYSDKCLQLQGTKEAKKEIAKFESLMKNLSLWTGKTIRDLQDVIIIWGTLEIEKFMGLPLPEWTKNVYPDGDIFKAAVAYYKMMNYNKDLRRLNGGHLIRKFLEDMESVRNGTMDKKRKLMLYSGHDLTIAAVLSALDIYYPHAPQFSSAVIVELHLIDSIYYVKVLYYLGEPDEIIELRIPNCDVLCPLDQFKNLTKGVIPSDFEWNCGNI